MAAKRRKQEIQDETLIDLSQAKVSAEHFWERNQKLLIGVVGALVVIIGGYLFYRFAIIEPRQNEAVEQMFQAQIQFERDSFNLALNNPGGGYAGFLEIIDQYGGTPAANTAKLYAGLSYLHLGQFEDAISYLKKFKAPDDIMGAMKVGALGDAYAETNDLDKAMAQYRKAAKMSENQVVAPYYLLKVGQLAENQGDYAGAREAYETIKKDYAESLEGADIDKYLARVASLEK